MWTIHDDSWTEIVVSSDDVETDLSLMRGLDVAFEFGLGSPIMSRNGRHLVAAHFQDPHDHSGLRISWVDAPEAALSTPMRAPAEFW